jgi:hypothetical protein
MTRSLPSSAEAAQILTRLRTRPARAPPPLAGRALGPTLKALEARFGQGVDGLKSRWSEIVGTALWRRTEPVRLSARRGGGGATLEIRVDGPSATLIQHQAGDILARVNLYLGEGAAERLRIVQGPVRRPSAAPPRRIGGGGGPLPPDQEEALAASVDALPEGPLKAALMGLGREVWRRRQP